MIWEWSPPGPRPIWWYAASAGCGSNVFGPQPWSGTRSATAAGAAGRCTGCPDGRACLNTLDGRRFGTKEKRKGLANRIFSGVGLGIGAAILVWLIFYVRANMNLAQMIRSIRPLWLAGAALCVPVSESIDALIFYYMGRRAGCKPSLSGCFDAAYIGEFYFKLGPAGAPVQIKLMLDAGFPGTFTASIYVWKFVANATVYALFSLGALSLKVLIYHERLSPATAAGAVILLALYLFACTMALLCAVRPAPVMRLSRWVLATLSRWIRPLRKKGRIDTLMARLGDISDQLRTYQGDKKLLAGLFIGMVLELTALFAIPLFLYRGLGLSGYSSFELLLTQGLVMLITRIVMLPGNVGGAEGSFYLFMSPIFGTALPVALVLWRFASFVEVMILGAVWSVIRFAIRALRTR